MDALYWVSLLVPNDNVMRAHTERDGVVFDDELDDKGSDWELMRKAVLWTFRK